MSRHWLTSTTALALVLNAAAPLPSAAYDKAALERAAPRLAADTRLAENENNTAAQELMSNVLGEVPATESGEQSTDGTAAAEAEAVRVAAEEAARLEAEAAAAEAAAADAAEAEADAATQAAADAAAQTEADAAAQAEADAAAQTEADAAAQAEADAAAQAEADAAAQAEADAAAQAEADAAAQAEADAAAQAEADAAAQAEADAAAQAEADAAAKAADSAVEQAPAQSGESATSPVIGEAPRTESTENAAQDVVPEISAADQATAAELADESAGTAAAASGEAEVVDTQEMTVTEENSRASSEEFTTSASGQAAPTAQIAPPKKKDNDLLKTLGIAAAAGLGAYVIGRMLDGGGQVVSNTGDRVVVQEPSGAYRIIKDDDTLLRRPGNDVQTQTYSDGSTRSSVTATDGSSTVTIRAADGRVLRRTRVLADGREVVLFDDTKTFARVDVNELERANATASARNYDYSTSDADQLRLALNSANGQATDRTYSLNQIRQITAVRHLVPVIALDAINFKTGSAVIDADEAQDLSELGRAMVAAINDDPSQVFLIEGHTDSVGAASYNLALSDRRAESVALALVEYFDVPPANMIVQGYGESDLRIREQGDIRANRRGAVRNITPLLAGGR